MPKEKIKTTKKISIEIDNGELINMLKETYTICENIPSNAKIFVGIPGGGDWSNCELDIDPQTPITISWNETDSE